MDLPLCLKLGRDGLTPKQFYSVVGFIFFHHISSVLPIPSFFFVFCLAAFHVDFPFWKDGSWYSSRTMILFLFKRYNSFCGFFFSWLCWQQHIGISLVSSFITDFQLGLPLRYKSIWSEFVALNVNDIQFLIFLRLVLILAEFHDVE